MSASIDRRRRADLLSVTGAAVAGAGVGAWLGAILQPWAFVVLAVGAMVHAVGMTTRYRMDRIDGPLPRTWRVLYVACWIAIVALLVAIALGGAAGPGE